MMKSESHFLQTLIKDSMKSIEGQKPLCYQLDNNHLISSLPYIDEEKPEYKTKIQYLIKSQQKQMPYEPQKYLLNLKQPDLPLITSAEFNSLAESIIERLEKKEDKQLKGNQLVQERSQLVKKEIIKYQNNIMKDLNLQVYQKLGPLLMKKTIQALQNRKALVRRELEEEQRKIEEINKLRKYEQLQAQDREQTVHDRTRVMIHKKRKIQS